MVLTPRFSIRGSPFAIGGLLVGSVSRPVLASGGTQRLAAGSDLRPSA
jgi:hypothetical protein